MNVFTKVLASVAMLSAMAIAQAANMPPQIPHPIDSYKITEGNNPCLMCHQLATATPGQKTQIPLSHQKDGKVAGSHFNCVMCHVEKK